MKAQYLDHFSTEFRLTVIAWIAVPSKAHTPFDVPVAVQPKGRGIEAHLRYIPVKSSRNTDSMFVSIESSGFLDVSFDMRSEVTSHESKTPVIAGIFETGLKPDRRIEQSRPLQRIMLVYARSVAYARAVVVTSLRDPRVPSGRTLQRRGNR
jgi:hypothetical protein